MNQAQSIGGRRREVKLVDGFAGLVRSEMVIMMMVCEVVHGDWARALVE